MHAAMSSSEQLLVRSYTWDIGDRLIVSSSCSSSWSCRISDQAHMYTVILLDLISGVSQFECLPTEVLQVPPLFAVHLQQIQLYGSSSLLHACMHCLAPMLLLIMLLFEVPKLLLEVSRLIACLTLGCYSMMFGIDGICNGGPMLLHGQ